MPWATRGLRDGVLTTRWPHRADAYFDEFPGTVTVTDPDADAPVVDTAIAACPTAAISRSREGRLSLDQGRCILCGRCPALAPEAFAWQPGSAVSTIHREGLVVGDVPDTDETLRELRAAVNRRVRRMRRSVNIRHVDTGSDGSDEWEVQALTNPVYDVHRLGIFFTASPRHADILLLTGIGTNGMIDPVRRTLEAMPRPVVVIAAGVDAVSGGLIGSGYMGGHGVSELLDARVDVWVPGSPATPFALLHGVLLALDRLPAGAP